MIPARRRCRLGRSPAWRDGVPMYGGCQAAEVNVAASRFLWASDRHPLQVGSDQMLAEHMDWESSKVVNR